MRAPSASHRLGLRTRAATAFAALAFLIAATVAVLAYALARSYTIEQREASATRQAFVNARTISDALPAERSDPGEVLSVISASGRSIPTLRVGDEWFSASVLAGNDALPASVVATTETGEAARQRVTVRGEPTLVVGVPLPALDATYFESFPLTELDRTLRTLAFSLAVGAAAATVGGALLGRWLSGRVLNPLREVAEAAERIAGGRFDTRLETAGDPDLAPLLHSFNDMADAVNLRLEREARFTSDVSHELRTPLTALSAATSVLERRIGPDEPALTIIRSQVERFEQLVLALLEISRYDAGVQHLERTSTDLTSLVMRVLESTGHQIPVQVEHGAGEPVMVDARRVERVLVNLIDNADAYAGGPTRVGLARTSDAIVITVDDAGPGIAPEERDRIFERFYRGAPKAGESNGSGLGLALVAEHVGLHGGRIRIDDAPGGGARFVVELPVDGGHT